MTKCSGSTGLLTSEEIVRGVRATSELCALGELGAGAAEQGLPAASLGCLSALLRVAGVSGNGVHKLFRPIGSQPGSSRVSFEALSCMSPTGQLSDRRWHPCLGVIGEQLGVASWLPTSEAIETLPGALRSAWDLLASDGDFGPFAEVVTAFTGVVFPFRCLLPESGSSSALQLPGLLLLPSGVPDVLLAECWLHEALHTELHLAEWLSGQPLAASDVDLPTPWRTVHRPAAMLLHGAYVFSVVAQFMAANRDEYERSAGRWHLSATRGELVPYRDSRSAFRFRARQVASAVSELERSADVSDYGRRAIELVKRRCATLE